MLILSSMNMTASSPREVTPAEILGRIIQEQLLMHCEQVATLYSIHRIVEERRPQIENALKGTSAQQMVSQLLNDICACVRRVANIPQLQAEEGTEVPPGDLAACPSTPSE